MASSTQLLERRGAVQAHTVIVREAGRRHEGGCACVWAAGVAAGVK